MIKALNKPCDMAADDVIAGRVFIHQLIKGSLDARTFLVDGIATEKPTRRTDAFTSQRNFT